MTRYECFEFLAPLITSQLVVGSLSGQRVEWGHLSQHEGNLLVASMGNALGIGLGLALVLPHRKVIVLESDGSLLLSLYNLPTLANLNPPNLVAFVFDNEVYGGTRISQPSATAGKTDLAAVARGAGIERTLTVYGKRLWPYRKAFEVLVRRQLAVLDPADIPATLPSAEMTAMTWCLCTKVRLPCTRLRTPLRLPPFLRRRGATIFFCCFNA